MILDRISIRAAQEGCDRRQDASKENSRRISIHAAQEGCDCFLRQICYHILISIHAAQEGCDIKCWKAACVLILFQSTQPKRAATLQDVTLFDDEFIISIHAAQEGCDRQW